MADLPNLPVGLSPGLKNYLEKLGESVQITDANRGSPLDSKPTFQDLVDIGLLNVSQSQALKSNGKSFNASTNQWVRVSSGGSSPFTDPPVAANLVVTMDTSNIVLFWDAAPDPLTQTLVYRSTVNNLTTAVQIGSTIGTTYVDNLPPDGEVYFYWLRQLLNARLSGFNQLSGTTIGNVAGAPVITYSFALTDLVLQWPTPTSTLLIKFYIIKYGSTYEGGVIVGTSNTNTLRITVDFGGTRTFWIAPVDVNNQIGLAGSIVVTVPAPNAPIVSQSIQNDALVLTYAATVTVLPVSSYEVRYGASFAAGISLTIGAGTRFEQAVNWTGSRTFWVAATDSAGNVSLPTQIVFTPGLPSVSAIAAQIIDNNVLLSWTQTAGTLSIDHHLIDKNGTPIGNVTGTFTAIFEASSGTYVYGVTPFDTAGNSGVRVTTTATVSQPPDFVLYSDVNSAFAGTKTQTIIDATGALVASVDDTETWATHFTSRSWSSIDDQIAAGYTNFIVGQTTGSYVETVDYGVSIASTRITITPTTFASTGTVTVTPTIETSPNNSSWTSLGNVLQAVGTSFRYVRFTLSFSAAHTGTGGATDTANIIAISPLNYRLDTKQKDYRGTVSAISSDTGGTSVDITGIFLDVISIDVSPQGTTPLYCVYDFTDVPNPTSFKVLVFNSSGTRVSATVSFVVTGV